METEFEAKFYPIDKEKYRQNLKTLGAKIITLERKMVRIIADVQANPKFPRSDYLRIRNEGNIVRISYKTTAEEAGNLADQKEIDVEVSDFEKTKEIFELVGVKFNRIQETLREEWEYKGAQITIDTWPGLLTYSEIEAESEEKVKEIAGDIVFDWDRRIITTATEIFAKAYGLSISEVLDKISNITFENNPFEGLQKVWNPEPQI